MNMMISSTTQCTVYMLSAGIELINRIAFTDSPYGCSHEAGYNCRMNKCRTKYFSEQYF